jgi:hypothetical protein
LDTFKNFEGQLYTVNDSSFEEIALQLFRIQARHNSVYNHFLTHLGIDPDKIHSLPAIPFLPISFFKQFEIRTGEWIAQTVFGSSGTTGSITSRHLVKDLDFYLRHSLKNFEHFFGPITDYHFLALLPSYLERQDSSLVAMIDHLIKKSGSQYSGFYLDNIDTLLSDLEKLKSSTKKPILWGVSFALLDLAEKYHPDLSHCLIFETGGMKGRKRSFGQSSTIL